VAQFLDPDQDNAIMYASGEILRAADYPADLNKKDVGGPFHLERTRIRRRGQSVSLRGVGVYKNYTYKGMIYPYYFAPSVGPRSVDLNPYGPDAYARMKPTKPDFAGLNFLYELKDLPGMLRQRLSHNGLKDMANYWLALKFGWEPLLRDLRDMVMVQSKIQKHIDFILRNAGKPVHRRVQLYEWINVPSSTHFAGSGMTPGFASQPTSQARYTLSDYDRTEIWASASFRFWLPEGMSPVQYRRKLWKELMGLTPRPSVVWKAMPWSWLIDWFGNVGNVISNLEAGAADRLAADWFYLMGRTVRTRTCHAEATYNGIDNQPVRVSVDGTFEATWKRRLRGDPFGFGTKPGDLSPMQLSILGALGASRL